MKVLIVDNGTHYKKKLANLVEGHDITTVDYSNVSLASHAKGFDLILLSGAYNTYHVKKYGRKIFKAEQELIQKTKTPIVGICFGAQMIANVYGARLTVRRGGKIKGLRRIYNVVPAPYKLPYYGGKVFSSRRWCITQLPDTLQALSAGQDGVEVFRHVRKPQYGLQFHPERRIDDNDGKRIFDAIVELELSATK